MGSNCGVRIGLDLLLIYAAALLRSAAVGLSGVLLGIYLSQIGFSATTIGAVITAGLVGTALGTLVVSLRADRLGRRRTLAGLALLSALGGAGLVVIEQLPGILLTAFLGMVNGMGRDRGAAYALEQAMLPVTVSAERRTWAMAWYSLVLDAGHALGALAGAAPYMLRSTFGLERLDSYRAVFGAYAGLHLLALACYAFLSRRIESPAASGQPPARISPGSRRVIARLAALFALDSLGGGFLTGALVAYWFFRRFGVAEQTLGPLFFAVRVANSLSYLAAAWLARRIGLVNTMVFTHLPSNLFLMALPLAPTFGWAVALFLLREMLVEMDVPTRQSYVVAVVAPEERVAASGLANLTRNVGWAAAPSFAGYVMQHLSLGAPLLVGGGLKIIYDLLLFAMFRRIRPPEEQQ